MAKKSTTTMHNLLSQMTLDEKIGQLNQPNLGETNDYTPIRQGKVGSLIIASGALTGQDQNRSVGVEQANHLQQAAMESRLKIPLIFGRDVIHGCRTIFPIPLAQAAAFSPDLAEAAASIAAMEATAGGVKWTFAPMLDIARDPRWGRVAEGNGEDPYLGSQMATALVRGYQGDDMGHPEKLVACAKHYVGYGSAEGGRDYENGEISEPTLRDIYLPPFESAVRAGVATVMSAFIDLNGIPATSNGRLLTEILRGEWGFDGFVVSDWDSVAELINHGITEDRAGAACIALQAGVDMDMASGAYAETLMASLQAGRISMQEIDQAVLRILQVKQHAGLFEQPYTDPSRLSRQILTSKSRQLARQFGRECMVLLKNERETLPLHDTRKILVAGKFINARSELYGTWSPDAQAEDAVPLQEALKEVAPNDVSLWFTEDIDRAQELAQQADVVVLLLGEIPSRSGENANLSDLCLPADQADWVDKMAASGKPVVLVIFAGRPLVLTRQTTQVQAILYAWHPGIEGGAALAEILFGVHAPMGRLPITFPRATGQVPIYYNHKNSGRPIASEGWFSRRYLDLPNTPLFPFGFGLDYTTFTYTNIQLSHNALRDQLTISAEVTNTGKYPGNTLTQLYVRDLVGSISRPVRELKGFQRISLQPGETQHVRFTLSEDQLAFTRLDGTRGSEPGRYRVWIAPDSASGISADFMI